MEKKLEKVMKALDRVNAETNQMILKMANSMTELEVIQNFNQNSLDFFNLAAAITKRMGKENEYKMEGYKTLYENTLKYNIKLPIDHYTLLVLEFAPEVYSEKESFFLDLPMGDAHLEVNNEFGLIRSQMFKNIWKMLDKKDKEQITEKVLLLTTFAHVYFYQTVLKKKK